MAQKLHTAEEAAEILGVSVDDLMAMRERGEVYAYKDGGQWKFRDAELERIKAERDDGPLDFTIDDDPASGVLDSKIGGKKPGNSDVLAGSTPSGTSGISDLDLAFDSGVSFGEEKAAGGSDKLGSVFDDLDDMSLQVDEGSIKGVKKDAAGGSTGRKPSKAAEPDEISLDDDDSLVGGPGGSAIDLTGEDEDLVLSGSDSDITRRPADSGINLSPADSGLSLEEPMQIGGSAVDSFQLGEDSSIRFDEKASPDSPTQKQTRGDDDFDFTAAPSLDDEDSGSQVIPIDEDDDDLGLSPVGGMAAALEVDEDDVDMAPRPASTMAAVGEGEYVAPEAPYSIWNVLSLACCTLILMFGGMLMYDLIRNMWSWDQPYSVTSGIMNQVATWFK
ncbi:MAG: helix-turn-helix domain-containing protein [Pirellulales bacterium]